jgi:hypothetical protein
MGAVLGGLQHLPYSPDLAPFDLFLFPRQKSDGRTQCTSVEIERILANDLSDLSENDFRGALKHDSNIGRYV